MGSTDTQPAARDAQVELLERAWFLEELSGQLEQAGRGSGGLVLVVGEAGVGKTALLRLFCAERAETARVLLGASEGLQTPRALGPLVDVAEETGGELAELLGRGAGPHDVLGALLRELDREVPTVVVLEDLHWADQATLDLLRLAARRIEATHALLIASYRDDELERTHPLRVLAGELATSPAVHRIQLPPLSREAVGTLAAPHGVDPDELFRKTAGNPFFVTEALGAGSRELPSTVRDAVLGRAARLGPDAFRLLEAVAVVPQQVELWLLETLAADDVRHLDGCLASGMLRFERGAVGFRHELARLAIEESIPPLRQTALHRVALDALVNRATGTTDPARVAHHADAAGDVDAVLKYAPAAAERAARLGAHQEAVEQYALAIRVADGLPPERRLDLLDRCSYACYVTERLEEAVRTRQAALDLARELGDRLSEGDCLRWLARLLWCVGRNDDAAAAATEAVEVLEQLPPGVELARAYAAVAQLRMIEEDNDEAVAWGEKAIELAERIGDVRTLTQALTSVGAARASDGSPQGFATLRRGLDVALEAGLDEHVVRADGNLAASYLGQRMYREAERALDEGLGRLDELDIGLAWQDYPLSLLAQVQFEQGRWAAATETAERVLARGQGLPLARLNALVVLGRVRARRGDPGVWAPLDEAHAIATLSGEIQQVGFVAAGRAEAALHEGEPEAVDAETAEALALAADRGNAWLLGELALLRRQAGIEEPVPPGVAQPFAIQLAGEHEQAAAAWAEIGCPYEAATALTEAGTEDSLRRAVEEFQRLEAGPAAAAATQKLRELLARGPRTTTLENPANLTPRELQVLALVVEGLRNADIAARLVVSEKTVDHHVSAILRKLGVRSRTEAGTAAIRLGLS